MSGSAGHLEINTVFASAPARDTSAYRFWLQAAARELLPEERVRICYRHRLPGQATVNVKLSARSKRAYYNGLMKCKALWQCPVCASKMAGERAIALKQAVENNRDKFVPFLATYTLRHSVHDALDTSLTSLLDGYRKFKGTRVHSAIMAEFDVRATVRALEITHGQSGWHPHLHEILFVSIDVLATEPDTQYLATALENHLAPEWMSAARRAGFETSLGHGIKVTSDYGNVAEYLAKMDKLLLPRGNAKWGIADEVARGNTKTARAAGMTPFALLEEYALTGEWKYAALFIEYARATKGRSALQWSKGAKVLLGYDERETEDQPEDRLLASLSIEQWRVILKAGKRGELLDVASTKDIEDFHTWLDGLPGMSETEAFYGIDT